MPTSVHETIESKLFIQIYNPFSFLVTLGTASAPKERRAHFPLQLLTCCCSSEHSSLVLKSSTPNSISCNTCNNVIRKEITYSHLRSCKHTSLLSLIEFSGFKIKECLQFYSYQNRNSCLRHCLDLISSRHNV